MKQWFVTIVVFGFALVTPQVKAAIISVGFSGVISMNAFDVPVGSILSGKVEFNSEAELVIAGEYGHIKFFPIISATINLFNESATINEGLIKVNDGYLDFSAGPALGLARMLGMTNEFSNTVGGVRVGGFGFNVEGNFIENQLPQASAIYSGQSGTIFVNRSTGALFDIASPENLRVPSSNGTQVVTPPALGITLTALLVLIVRFRRGN